MLNYRGIPPEEQVMTASAK